jgi:uncharacterized protein (DUF2252 family)
VTVVELKANIDPSYYRLLYGQERDSLADIFQAARPSVEERLAAGKALREKVPRTAHAAYKAADRPDPVDILEQQNLERHQKLVPVRYARMLVSPFAFLRGSAAVMASDLSRTPLTGMAVGACGDMHVSNFGVYASAERNLVFAINDFDEIHPGPWEWDVKRLAASAAVAVRFMGGDKAAAAKAAVACVASYRRRMRDYSEMGYLEIWYDTIDEREMLEALSPRVRRSAERTIAKARAKGHIRSLDKLTEQVDGEPRFVEDLPLIVRETHSEKGTPIRHALNEMLAAYVGSLALDRQRLLARYRLVDVARKVVGVGSVGTEAWILLLVDGRGTPLFLQVKEAGPSVLESFTPGSDFSNQGERVVLGQRLMQAAGDIFLGWERFAFHGGEREYYVRQLRDWKGSADVGRMTPEGMELWARMAGWTLARAHARSGDRHAIAAYLGKSDVFDRAMAEFSVSYADQNERDYESLKDAVASGRLKAAVGI